MSNMIITVEFLAGTTIEDAVYEAITRAKQLDVAYIRFKFNGVAVSVSPTLKISKQRIFTLYNKALASKSFKCLILSGEVHD